ncbi:MAG TPA: YdcF family protein [Spirochaetota bacterium]|nr:YdcF family protein [Spirochaetota bacterium]HPC41952.1 YdcF family protein [Spirochaetota bacterium]HPL17014.1 YdcF family protein [Spirochaetota bacterium]HQF07002.1 YdcF family protein [Spirochaetota bacterium]HQH95739.1 YdcF family protein [Spirochaetota bacterium]
MKFRIIVIIVILIVMAAAVLHTVVSFVSYGGNAVSGKADAAIVLGAASYGDRPSPVFRERINHALWLYRNGFVKKIIFTGARDSGNEPPASTVASHYAAGRGVPMGDILGEDRSRTTEENLSRARDLAEKNGLKTFLIVSDPLHMKRAMRIARDLGMAAHPSPTPTTRYRGFISRMQFLGREMYFYDTYAARQWALRVARHVL